MSGSCSSAECCRYRLKSSFYPKGMSTLAKPKPSPSSSPWLMLQPAFDVDVSGSASRSFKFYSLADNKIVTLSTGKSSKERELRNPLLCFRGSSHGWLALYDESSLDVFLYNPITGGHISLPPFGHFPDYPPNSNGLYKKVILSCSPDDDGPNCRAIMIYNNVAALAFCCPGLSKEWTRIGDHNWFDQDSGQDFFGGYEDCVYSTRHEALFCLTRLGVLESWDIRDPQSPRAVKIAEDSRKVGRLGYPRTGTKKLTLTSTQAENLVVAGEDLLVVTQYVVDAFDFDGLYVDGNTPYDFTYKRGFPGVTVDFDVHKYDPEDGELKYVEGSFGGWALFVGLHSHAVALPTADFPELKPNSIYFTDANLDASIEEYNDCLTGGHDIGIFNYENKTVSPCYFPCDAQNLRKTYPGPMWFFPSRE
ncbi:hypothetical protein STAS_25134 [Striga asiatica]|uniref:KIB1-4 beta-propeller domain-containing protein n=1 Tax=Striga asiatica TaxID=4170 RepID=A0A5A7QSX3_STRAF|nr:hypothetical protein STAS_25134 [Striga asiatica]